MKEHLWAFSLNNQSKILALELVSIGTKNKTLADPGDVFRSFARMGGGRSIVFFYGLEYTNRVSLPIVFLKVFDNHEHQI